MRVLLTTDRMYLGAFQSEGDVIDLADDEARRLVASGQAELIKSEPIETAMRAPATENAMARQTIKARK